MALRMSWRRPGWLSCACPAARTWFSKSSDFLPALSVLSFTQFAHVRSCPPCIVLSNCPAMDTVLSVVLVVSASWSTLFRKDWSASSNCDSRVFLSFTRSPKWLRQASTLRTRQSARSSGPKPLDRAASTRLRTAPIQSNSTNRRLRPASSF